MKKELRWKIKGQRHIQQTETIKLMLSSYLIITGSALSFSQKNQAEFDVEWSLEKEKNI